MPFPTRIQPIESIRTDASKSPVKSRLKRLFDRPRTVVFKIPPANSAAAEFEPSSVCLDRMVQNFIEDGASEKHTSTAKCSRNRCCFSGNSNDSSDDELDFSDSATATNSSIYDPFDTLKSLIPCASVEEKNLLAESSIIVERNSKTCKRKDDLRKIVAGGLIALGYNASVCKSKWEKSPGIPAGEYEYIDVIIEDERLLIDIDFRSEFEIARSTSTYKAILQCLPVIYVGKSDRLVKIVSIASESLRRSLRKKGMHVAPWRKPEYIRSKWIGPYTRVTGDLVVGTDGAEADRNVGEEKVVVVVEEVAWRLPAVKAKSLDKVAVVTGLASLLEEKIVKEQTKF